MDIDGYALVTGAGILHLSPIVFTGTDVLVQVAV